MFRLAHSEGKPTRVSQEVMDRQICTLIGAMNRKVAEILPALESVDGLFWIEISRLEFHSHHRSEPCPQFRFRGQKQGSRRIGPIPELSLDFPGQNQLPISRVEFVKKPGALEGERIHPVVEGLDRVL